MKAWHSPWWLTILQGIIFLFTGLLLLSEINKTLEPFVTLMGIAILIAGVSGFLEWYTSKNFDKNISDFLWSIMCVIEGLLLFVFQNYPIHFLYMLLGIWLIVSSIWITYRGWELQWIHAYSWGIAIAGVTSLFFGFNILLFPRDEGMLNMKLLVAVLFLFSVGLFAIGYVKKEMMEEK